jgi:hypothetical protein
LAIGWVGHYGNPHWKNKKDNGGLTLVFLLGLFHHPVKGILE